MLSKEFERKIATLEDLPELREITWQMRAALEKAYKETLKDLNEVSTPMRCIAPMDMVSKAELRSENTH